MNIQKSEGFCGGYFYEFTMEERGYNVVLPVEEITDMEAYCCSYRANAYFMTGKTGTEIDTIPRETQFLAVKHTDGSYSVYFSIVDEIFRSSMHGGEGKLYIAATTGDEAVTDTAFCGLYRIDGEDFYGLVERAAASLSQRFSHVILRETKKEPEFAKYFGWCTWDSFYEKVTGEDIRRGLESFREGGFVPRFMILDDGWQSVEPWGKHRGEWKLTSFRANEKFGHNLKDTVKMAKEEFGVEKFFVWHAVMGYWGGVSLNSPEMAKYRPVLNAGTHVDGIKKNNPDWWETDHFPFGLIDSDKAFDFYNDYHSSLKKEGVDGVKIDVQAAVASHGRGHGGRTNLVRKMRTGLEASVAYHFDGEMINCMSCSNDVIYNSRRTNMMRSSGDFFPNDTNSHVAHIYSNAVNSIWMGCFTGCDWDMFQTKHEYGPYHAAARAISGGPVYVSDRVDEHDFVLIGRLTDSDGRILKAEGIAKPTLDCLFTDLTQGRELFKIFNRNKYNGVVGVFASAEGGKKAISVTPEDIVGFAAGQYVCHSDRTGKNHMLAAGEAVVSELDEKAFDILTFAEVKDGLAFLGLTEKMNGGAALEQMIPVDNGTVVNVSDGGTFLFYCARKIEKICVNGREAEYSISDGFVTVALKEKSTVFVQYS